MLRHILAMLMAAGICAPLNASLFDQGAVNGPDAAAAAQGWASVARPDGAAAVALNPAGLWGGEGFALQSEYASLLGGRQAESGLFHRGSLPELGLGYGLAYRRVDDTAAPNRGEQQLSLGLGLPFSEDQSLRIGAALKAQQAGYGRTPAPAPEQAWGLDLGILWSAPWWERRLTLGGDFINLVSSLSGGDDLPRTLPADSQLGAAWSWDPSTRLEADAELIDQSRETLLSSQGLRLGGEHWMLDGLLALRLGWAAAGNLPSRWSLGLGLRWQGLGLDYAFMQDVDQLGASHRLSAAWQFGLPKPAAQVAPALAAPSATPLPSPSAVPALSAIASMLMTASPTTALATATPTPTAWLASAEGATGTATATALPFATPTWSPTASSTGTPTATATFTPGSGLGGAHGPEASLAVKQAAAGGQVRFIPLAIGDLTAVRSWSLAVLDAAGDTLWARSGDLPLPLSLAWDGRDSLGSPAEPGPQVARLTLLDASHALASAEAAFSLAAKAASLELSADPAVFSPTPGSRHPAARLAWSLRGAKAESWDWKIIDARDRLVASAHGQGSPAQPLAWDGRWQRRRLPQGPYRFELRIQPPGHAKRLKATASVQIDMSLPEPQLAAERQVFDAEAAGPAAVSFIPSASSRSGVEAWSLEVATAEGALVRRLEGQGEPPERILWDGRDAAGAAVEPGQLYSAVLAISARSGAQGRSASLPLQSDVRAFHESTAIRVPLTSLAFAAGAEGLSPEQMASLQAAGQAAKRFGERYLIQVKGYAGEDEAAAGLSALELSARRARAASDYLAKAVGLPPEALTCAGYGAAPAGDAALAGDPARQRRVDVILCTR
jgi:outer membrane protein OmpA-like peptidoglycan-associated protein